MSNQVARNSRSTYYVEDYHLYVDDSLTRWNNSAQKLENSQAIINDLGELSVPSIVTTGDICTPLLKADSITECTPDNGVLIENKYLVKQAGVDFVHLTGNINAPNGTQDIDVQHHSKRDVDIALFSDLDNISTRDDPNIWLFRDANSRLGKFCICDSTGDVKIQTASSISNPGFSIETGGTYAAPSTTPGDIFPLPVVSGQQVGLNVDSDQNVSAPNGDVLIPNGSLIVGTEQLREPDKSITIQGLNSGIDFYDPNYIHPSVEIYSGSINDSSILFDTYYDVAQARYESSILGTNFMIHKDATSLSFQVDSANFPGNAVTWVKALEIDASENVTIENGILKLGPDQTMNCSKSLAIIGNGKGLDLYPGGSQYPSLEIHTLGNDNSSISFDACYNTGGSWESGDVSSNYLFTKNVDKLTFYQNSGTAQGSTISAWTKVLEFDTNSDVLIPNGNLTISGGTNGLYLPSTGGTPALLDHYEELIINPLFSGPWTVSTTMNITLVRTGRVVSCEIREEARAANSSTYLSCPVGSIPARFQPDLDLYSLISIQNNNILETGNITFLSDGSIEIAPGFNKQNPFTASGNCGVFFRQSFTWHVAS